MDKHQFRGARCTHSVLAFPAISSSNYMGLFLRREQSPIAWLQIVEASNIFIPDATKKKPKRKTEKFAETARKYFVDPPRIIDRSLF